MIEQAFDEHIQCCLALQKANSQHLVLKMMAELSIQALRKGRHIYLIGNGGSAADAEHIAGELVGRFSTQRDRVALPVFALTTHAAVVTAIANDFSYDEVFERQVKGLVTKEDVLIAISTSGQSPNILKAVKAAKHKQALVFGWTGKSGGALKPLSDLCLQVPSDNTQRIQEMHTLCGHMFCDMIDQAFAATDKHETRPAQTEAPPAV